MELDQSPFVCLITEGRLNSANYTQESNNVLDRVRFAAQTGVSFVQIREKNLDARLLSELTARAVDICSQTQTRILVNERFDIAMAAGAAGVHLTSTSIPARIVRDICVKDFIIGVSTHTLEEAFEAQRSGADYAYFGPVFETPSKKKLGKPKGLNSLSEVCRELKGFPVFALGGIESTNIENVLNAGASGYAAIRMFTMNNE